MKIAIAAIALVLFAVGASAQDSGKIVVYNANRNVFAKQDHIHCDGKEVARVKRSQYAEIILSEGRHYCYSRGAILGVYGLPPSVGLVIDMKGGDILYFASRVWEPTNSLAALPSEAWPNIEVHFKPAN
jgi:hypothetical protein